MLDLLDLHGIELVKISKPLISETPSMLL